MSGDDELPEGWNLQPFEALVENFDGKRVPVKASDRADRQGKYPYYGASGIIDQVEDYLFDGDYLLIAEDGANLLSRSTPIAFQAHGRFWVNNHAHIVRPQNGAPIGYLESFLNSIDLTPFVTGSAQPKLTQKALNAIEVPTAPLPEQRRIVAKLESLQARSRRAREALEAVPALLEKLRQSILAAAFRGDLTKDWREKHPDLEPPSKLVARTPIPEGKSSGRAASISHRSGRAAICVCHPESEAPADWEWVPLSRIAKMESGHTPSRDCAEYWNGGIPWIGIKDAREFHGKAIPQTFQTVSDLGLANSAARLLPKGTVCLSRTASVGYVTIMGDSMATSQDFANWVCTRALLPEYLMFALLAEGEHIRTFGEGTTHTTIYFPELKALHICLAPLAEQHEIVRRVRQQLAVVKQLELLLIGQFGSVGQLDSAILSKAFRGELVPRDPSEWSEVSEVRGVSDRISEVPKAVPRGKETAGAKRRSAPK